MGGHHRSTGAAGGHPPGHEHEHGHGHGRRRRGPSRAAVPAALGVAAVASLVVGGCESPVPFYRPGEGGPDAPVVTLGGPVPFTTTGPSAGSEHGAHPGTGAHPVANPETDVYGATRRGMLSAVSRTLPDRVFVPNAASGTVDVIDRRTGRLSERARVGGAPSRLTPRWDLGHLWVQEARRGRATAFSPRSARPAGSRTISRTGRLYFTPDGATALLMAGGQGRIDVRAPGTLALRTGIDVPCRAAHAGFSADGSVLLATCAKEGRVVRVDLASRTVTGVLRLPPGSRPGDLRLAPDGSVFYVSDAARGGLWLVDPRRLRTQGFVRTGRGAGELVLGRDARHLYVGSGNGTVSRVDLATRRVAALWTHPAGRPAALGGVSAGGGELWLSVPAEGRVLALSTRTGRVLHDVRVGGSPRAPVVFPQPGRFSLGGTGVYR